VRAGDAAIELAERRVAMETAASVARIQAKLARTAANLDAPLVCDCGEEISPARRPAMPHTRKCIDCATFSERLNRRRA